MAKKAMERIANKKNNKQKSPNFYLFKRFILLFRKIISINEKKNHMVF
jgi:hypothetical protein